MNPDKKLAAVCGLYCGSCSVYIGTHEDEKRLQAFADRSNQTLEETRCNGCRSDKRTAYCNSCTFTKCAADKRIEFCAFCEEYPCNDLKVFQSQYPHRIELWESHKRIKEAGWETWFNEMNDHYSCKKCGTLNSAYDINCRKCGEAPSSSFVELHKNEVIEFLKKR
jgi:hypothetical protein